ncbi:MAG: zf-HC2 domain-containing protein [Ignavibacteriales bacterium]|nr:zf-HC2 domain-containing protein [Ignavibacteriales bacterium]
MEHWTRNPELLEQYVLDRLGNSERVSLDEHLRECDSCRKAVQDEKDLIFGVKRFGREEMKQRLAARVQQSHTGPIPWPHVVSVAAVLLIVVGLGIYNRWWWGESTLVLSEKEIGTTMETGKTDLPLANEKREQPTDERGAVPLETAGETPSPPLRSGHRDRPAEDRAEAENLRKKESVRLESRELIAMDDVPGEGMKGEPSQVWVEGVIVGTAAGKTSMDEETARAAAPASTREFPSPPLQRRIAVSQKPTKEIPKMQQVLQPGATMRTSLERSKDRLNLIIYSDDITLSDQNIRVNVVAEDSLLVTINGLQIGYRIPRGWLQATEMK